MTGRQLSDRDLDRALALLVTGDGPADLSVRVRDAIARDSGARRPQSARLAWTAGAAAAVLIAATALWFRPVEHAPVVPSAPSVTAEHTAEQPAAAPGVGEAQAGPRSPDVSPRDRSSERRRVRRRTGMPAAQEDSGFAGLPPLEGPGPLVLHQVRTPALSVEGMDLAAMRAIEPLQIDEINGGDD